LVPLLLICLASVLALHWVIKAKPQEKDVKELSQQMYKTYWWQGKYPPDFELTLLSGERFVLSEHIGREVIVLNFFTTWCGPCKEELPELGTYYQRHRAEGLVLLGIDGNEKRDLVEKFAGEERVPFPVGIDEGEAVQGKFGVESYPTTIFIGADGKVSLYESGAIDNADVTFGTLFRDQRALLQKGLGISRQAYLDNLKKQPAPPDSEYWFPGGVSLEGRAKEFAGRMRCPYSHLSTLECHCVTCQEVRKRLKAMSLEGKSDEQILKALFLPDTLTSDTLGSQTPNPR
jgi:thiol-disulfide isomerase/thioredoxin